MIFQIGFIEKILWLVDQILFDPKSFLKVSVFIYLKYF